MEKEIEKLNQKLLSSLGEDFPIGLMHGKMGICIYFFYLGRMQKNKQYNNTAKKILEDICSRIGESTSIGFEGGVSGIALGIRHLIRENFISGNANEILQEIDDKIFNQLSFSMNLFDSNKFELDLILLYLCYRLKDQKKGSEEEYFSQEQIIRIVNYSYANLHEINFEEPISYSTSYALPIFLFIIGKIYSLDFYNYKIKKLIEEITPKVISKYPILDANKLFLLWGILLVTDSVKIKSWTDHAKRLQKEINVDKILNVELKHKNIFISDGVSSIYLLLLNIRKTYPDYNIPFDIHSIYDRIKSSEAWSLLLEEAYFFKLHLGLLSGMTGCILTILNIKSKEGL